jgi:hypothetical protein
MPNRKKHTTLFAIIVTIGFFVLTINALGQDSSIIATSSDRLIIEQKIERFREHSSRPIGDLILAIATDFIGTPYAAKTLDQQTNEPLVINLREFDCTTFIENCLALARTVKSSEPGYAQFIKELEQIRYRDGKRNGYTSRLHYFSEWIANNQSKNILKEITEMREARETAFHLNIMSHNPHLYPQLTHNPELVKHIMEIEKRLSLHQHHYIPKDKVRAVEALLQDGDIAAFTTSIKGLDVTHVGFMFHKASRIYLLHASSSGKKVEITNIPLANYLQNQKSTIGIMVIRPNFQEP